MEGLVWWKGEGKNFSEQIEDKETIYDVASLRVGDFDGDSIDDILGMIFDVKTRYSSGIPATWTTGVRISKGSKEGMKNWQKVADNVPYHLSDIGIGDFDGKQGDDLYVTFDPDKDGKREGSVSFITWDQTKESSLQLLFKRLTIWA